MEQQRYQPERSAEWRPRKIAIVGGPCAGKTTLLQRLEESPEFRGRYICVPEAATLLLPGFLAVRQEVSVDPSWQQHLQRSITAAQLSLEAAYEAHAISNRIDMIICDRGILDAAVYTPAGLEMLKSEFGIEKREGLARYDAVLHLESLASAAPSIFSNIGNETRYESVEEARAVEERTRVVWKDHDHFNFIGGADLDAKCEEALRILQTHIP